MAEKKADRVLTLAEARRLEAAGEELDVKRAGRPELVPTEEQTKAVTDALRAGGFLETAIAFSGVSKPTFYKWMKRGEKERRGPFRTFFDAVKKATAFAETRYLKIIGSAASSQWQAAAWILERRWPAKFARRSVPEGSHPSGGSSKP